MFPLTIVYLGGILASFGYLVKELSPCCEPFKFCNYKTSNDKEKKKLKKKKLTEAQARIPKNPTFCTMFCTASLALDAKSCKKIDNLKM